MRIEFKMYHPLSGVQLDVTNVMIPKFIDKDVTIVDSLSLKTIVEITVDNGVETKKIETTAGRLFEVLKSNSRELEDVK